ncbi:hypothetical protein EG329_011302 [Mollisiaceae sp. DMI_Dod_QoI]|nr:hypothetical protein EG329_011302 [Helotiales sp. DMI_Dod_QoI]
MPPIEYQPKCSCRLTSSATSLSKHGQSTNVGTKTQYNIGCLHYQHAKSASQNSVVFNGIGAWTDTMMNTLEKANGARDALKIELETLNKAHQGQPSVSNVLLAPCRFSLQFGDQN